MAVRFQTDHNLRLSDGEAMPNITARLMCTLGKWLSGTRYRC